MPARPDLAALDAQELLARGVAAARVGDLEAARAFLSELTARDPGHADAWLWRAGVEADPLIKRDCFERVLQLRPDDPDAAAGMDLLVARYGAAALRPADDGEQLFCHWHPQRPTALRCSRCARPICPACARRHPVGWRCKECARELRSPLYKVTASDAVRGLAAGTTVSLACALVVTLAVGLFGLLAFLLAVVAGQLVADGTTRAGGRKRGRAMQALAAASVVAGAALLYVTLALGPLRGALTITAPTTLIYGVIAGLVAWGRPR